MKKLIVKILIRLECYRLACAISPSLAGYYAADGVAESMQKGFLYSPAKWRPILDEKKAVQTLIALACCSMSALSCYDCPLHEADGRCKPSQDYEIIAAVRLLNEVLNNA